MANERHQRIDFDCGRRAEHKQVRNRNAYCPISNQKGCAQQIEKHCAQIIINYQLGDKGNPSGSPLNTDAFKIEARIIGSEQEEIQKIQSRRLRKVSLCQCDTVESAKYSISDGSL